MAKLVEPLHSCAYLVSERGDISREAAVIGANQDLVVGQVLGQLTVSKAFVRLNPTASDGSETAAGVALYAVKTGATTTKSTITARLTEVRAADLTWPAGISGPQKLAAIEDLAALNIILR